MMNGVLKAVLCLCVAFTASPALAGGLDKVFEPQAESRGGDRSDIASWADEFQRAQADEAAASAAQAPIPDLRLAADPLTQGIFLAWALDTVNPQADAPAACAADCRLGKWDEDVDALAARPRRDQLAAVQAMVNALPYLEDQDNWGRHDYWATPRQMIVRGGDCEDFATTKYWALRRLGVPDADMRIVVVHDRRFHSSHAVLVVRVDGEALVLDNQTKEVIAAGQARDYRPYYAVNGEGWWTYRGAGVRGAQELAQAWPAASAGGRMTITLRAPRAASRWTARRSFSLNTW